MIITTTPSVEGYKITDYRGIVVGEAIMGANVVRDVFASITDIVGGRSGAYESKLQDARETALGELEERAAALGANAVVGVDLDYEGVPNAPESWTMEKRLVAWGTRRCCAGPTFFAKCGEFADRIMPILGQQLCNR